MNTEYNSIISNENNSIPLTRPEISGNEWKYIKQCLDTGWVSSVGSFVEQFEEQIKDYIGTKYAVATVNGTSALHIALLVAGIKPDDEIVTSNLTFIAPINAIRYVGAWPVLIDAEKDFWQIDTIKLNTFIDKQCKWKNGQLINKKTKRRVKAILPVHILGHPVDIDPIINIAKKYNLKVIEDASESLGAKYKGKNVGSLSDISCLSFNGNKIITSGGGGMILTNNQKWAERAKYLTTQAKDHPLEYIHNSIGYNYRLTNIQAALGCAQIEKLDEFIDKRRSIAKIYKAAFDNLDGVEFIDQANWAFSTYWMPTVYIKNNDSRSILNELLDRNIHCRPLWQPMHISKAHRLNYYNDFNISESLFNNCICLPSFTELNKDNVNLVIEEIKSLVC